MSRLDAAQVRTVLYEGPGSLPLEPNARSRIVAALLDKGFAVTSLRDRRLVTALPRDFLLVLGRFTAEPPQFDGGVALRFQQIDGMDLSAVVQAAEELQATTGAVKSGAWKPWFPVIDYGRCTNCMQCLSFCLFDVYGVSGDSKIADTAWSFVKYLTSKEGQIDYVQSTGTPPVRLDVFDTWLDYELPKTGMKSKDDLKKVALYYENNYIDNWAHYWPGGMVNQGVEMWAEEKIWKFFEKHPLNNDRRSTSDVRR